ncbi:unnamed protein product [Paramecium sonneborni]|uniref:Protein kinase domain-containing protein n=1 Tax=Paramecium sonneborni TaxID=65129 RepID=A0A8S1KDG5_9CILI|nr:unnamed protein product [Paramecium sonneborni]
MSLFYQGWLAEIIDVKIDKIYDKEVILGEGGYGIVYRGKMWIKNINNTKEIQEVPIAIKRIYIASQNKNGKNPLENIKRELSVYQQIKSKNIVQLYGTQQIDKYYDLYLELCDGSLLDCIIDKNEDTPLQEMQALKYFKEIVDTLILLKQSSYQRSNNKIMNHLYHRDINVKNVLYKKFQVKNRIKICDFGISYYQTDINKNNLEMSLRTGTINFMSPENLQLENYDLEKNDTWGLGILLFCLLFGYQFYNRNQPKFQPQSKDDHLSLIKNSKFSSQAKELLIGLLQKDPKLRIGYSQIKSTSCYRMFQQSTLMKGHTINKFLNHRLEIQFEQLTKIFLDLKENLFLLIPIDLLLMLFYFYEDWIYKQCDYYSGYYLINDSEEFYTSQINCRINYCKIPIILQKQYEFFQSVKQSIPTQDKILLFWRNITRSNIKKIYTSDEKLYYINFLNEILDQLSLQLSHFSKQTLNLQDKILKEKLSEKKEKLNQKLQKLKQQEKEKEIEYEKLSELIVDSEKFLFWKIHKNYDSSLKQFIQQN